MGKLTIVCVDCSKVISSTNEPGLSGDNLSHGYCAKCADKRRKDLDDYKKNRQK